MSILLWMALGALISDILVLTTLALSPRLRRALGLKLLWSTRKDDDQEDGDEDL